MDNTIALIGVILASNGLWTFLVEVYKTRKKKKTPLEEMTLAMGRDRLLALSKHYLKLGYIPFDEYEALAMLGKAYIEMGGNSIVKKLYEQCMQLDVKEETEEDYE